MFVAVINEIVPLQQIFLVGQNQALVQHIIQMYGYDLHKTWAEWHPIYDWDSSCQGTVP